MKLLIVGQADSIFFEHYTKHIKEQIQDVVIDIFSTHPVTGKYDLSACNSIHGINNNSVFSKIKVVNAFTKPVLEWHSLISFLKKNGDKYDVIHFKWLMPSVVLFPGTTFKYCRNVVSTLWGGELDEQLKLFYSKKLYNLHLKKFLNKSDVVSYTTKELYEKIEKTGVVKSKLQYAIYGSSVYNEIKNLLLKESKRQSKKISGFDPEKTTITIGYSGKGIHQHKKIINELFANKAFQLNKDKFIFILPMSYGCNNTYREETEELLKLHDANYILLTDKMSDSEIARLRNATDITIQLSSMDGRSASIIEYLLAGSVLVSGKWLPYQVFKEKGIYFHELDSIGSELPELVLKIAFNIEDEQERCRQNKDKWGFETWGKVIDDWVRIYKGLL